MGSSRVSAVLFASDFAKLTTFYRDALGLTPAGRSDDHAVLSCPGFDLVVHQIPKAMADSIVIENPPRRREQAAIKLCFPVESLQQVRTQAASLGGSLNPATAEWMDGDRRTCMGNDPEGNVFQVSTRTL